MFADHDYDDVAKAAILQFTFSDPTQRALSYIHDDYIYRSLYYCCSLLFYQVDHLILN